MLIALADTLHKALFEILFHTLSELCDSRIGTVSFNQVRRVNKLFERRHIRPARGVIAYCRKYFSVVYTQNVLCDVFAEERVDYAVGHIFGTVKSFEVLFFQVLGNVMQGARKHDLCTVQLKLFVYKQPVLYNARGMIKPLFF